MGFGLIGDIVDPTNKLSSLVQKTVFYLVINYHSFGGIQLFLKCFSCLLSIISFFHLGLHYMYVQG